MGEIKNLNHAEAVEKLKSHAENKTCFLCSYNDKTMHTRPMMTQSVEKDGSIWFFSEKDSEKNKEILKNNSVELFFSDSKHDTYLYISGRASVMKDKKMIDKLWSSYAKAWFEGKDDPNLTLIKVEPVSGHYWDTIHGKIVSTFKILYSVVTGAGMDDSREGDINIQKTANTKKSSPAKAAPLKASKPSAATGAGVSKPLTKKSELAIHNKKATSGTLPATKKKTTEKK